MFVVMDKLFEKIGDYFNNLEMLDWILVVKIRRDGWEKLEVVCRVKNMLKISLCDEEIRVVVCNKLEE